ncbi:hypothetical protein E5288_WYG007856 [Bos mutus]|uniref:Forkhead box protein N3 n=1 Tax=Bos mutus TaxID=72004 RepID=A0A6B0RI99_9CETA|nr:hypothetical protein [Bos mutus]
MPPSKKPESSGISVSSGLSQCYRGSGFSKALQEDDDLDFPLPDIRLEEGAMEDEELTNLNWLHESKNLLKSFGDSVLRSVSPVQDPDDDPPPSPAHSDVPYDARQNPNCKPPYSFSCLIFMAIEDSPTKRLPVKDIYNWILEHFPYFANAPTGWKNSVRHNLSLNKCFKKVDKERSQSIGKGSLWCIDPEYRQNLIQALKKTPYHPHSNVFNTPPASPQAYQRDVSLVTTQSGDVSLGLHVGTSEERREFIDAALLKWEETGIGVETGLIYQGRGGGDGPHDWNKSQILIPFVILLPSPSKPPQQALRFAPSLLLGSVKTQTNWNLCEEDNFQTKTCQIPVCHIQGLSTPQDCRAGHLAAPESHGASEMVIAPDGWLLLGLGGALGKERSEASSRWLETLQGRGASENSAPKPQPRPDRVPNVAAPSLVPGPRGQAAHADQLASFPSVRQRDVQTLDLERGGETQSNTAKDIDVVESGQCVFESRASPVIPHQSVIFELLRTRCIARILCPVIRFHSVFTLTLKVECLSSQADPISVTQVQSETHGPESQAEPFASSELWGCPPPMVGLPPAELFAAL